jgi:hypothetical protein
VLAAYVVFAVADTFLHFTPEKSYISTLSDMIRGVVDSTSTSAAPVVVLPPVATETSIAPAITASVDTAKLLLDQ